MKHFHPPVPRATANTTPREPAGTPQGQSGSAAVRGALVRLWRAACGFAGLRGRGGASTAEGPAAFGRLPPHGRPDAATRIAQADALRDAGRWEAAAAAYESAIALLPGAMHLWVQLGNMRKDSGDLAAAEIAYRTALTLGPDVDDTHVQLGHALKLGGHRAEAMREYAKALRLNSNWTAALNELIALSETAVAEAQTSIGHRSLAELHQTVAMLRSGSARLEAALPDIRGLTRIPVAQYGLFRSLYDLAPPPAEPLSRWHVIVLDAAGDEAATLLRDLAVQQPDLVETTILARGETVLPTPAAGADYILLVRASMRLHPQALSWLAWAGASVLSDAICADEDVLTFSAAEGWRPTAPVLKSVHDPEADVPLYTHGLLALQAGPAATLLAAINGSADPIARIAETLGNAGQLAHLPRIVASRTTMLPSPPPRRHVVPKPAIGTLGLVIPTRNGRLLKACLESIRRTAENPAALEIVVVDNGADDMDSRSYLDTLRDGGAVTVICAPRPFNWSALSNAGAAATTSALLLFLNDDTEMHTPGWDRILRTQLARPEIGALGARLLYPDGEIQHAGIVFGPDRRAEHEGVRTPTNLPQEVTARWTARRRVAAVTGAFLACRRSDFERLGRFDETRFPIWFNDVDFCLRVRKAGGHVLFEPAITALHHESKTLATRPDQAHREAVWRESLAQLRRRWGNALAWDPSFNPAFARVGVPFATIQEPTTDAVTEYLRRSSQPNPWWPDDSAEEYPRW